MKKIYIFIFCFILFLPLVGIIFKDTHFAKVSKVKFQSLENRVREEDYKNLKLYIRDQYLFRNDFINALVWIKYFIFNKTINANKSILGNNDWIFLGKDYISNIDRFKGLHPLDLESLSKKIERFSMLLEEKHGKKFYFSIAPNKSSIYSEFLPLKIRRQKKVTISNFKNKNYIDLFSTLMDYKERCGDLIYYKTDTHWNQIGAYVALKKIREAILNSSNKFNCIDYTIAATGNLDLVKISKLPFILEKKDYIPESTNYNSSDYDFKYNTPDNSKYIDQSLGPEIVTNHQIINGKNILIVRDSFTNTMQRVGLFDSFYKVGMVHLVNILSPKVKNAFQSLDEEYVYLLIVERNVDLLEKRINELTLYYNLNK